MAATITDEEEVMVIECVFKIEPRPSSSRSGVQVYRVISRLTLSSIRSVVEYKPLLLLHLWLLTTIRLWQGMLMTYRYIVWFNWCGDELRKIYHSCCSVEDQKWTIWRITTNKNRKLLLDIVPYIFTRSGDFPFPCSIHGKELWVFINCFNLFPSKSSSLHLD